jgi:hypothetical protein
MIEELVVYQKVYDFLLWVKPTVQRFQKVHKYSLGVQLENSVLDLLKSIVRANNSRDKVVLISDCFVCFEIVKVLVRLSRDFRLLTVRQFEFSSSKLVEINRLLNGWSKKFCVEGGV